MKSFQLEYVSTTCSRDLRTHCLLKTTNNSGNIMLLARFTCFGTYILLCCFSSAWCWSPAISSCGSATKSLSNLNIQRASIRLIHSPLGLSDACELNDIIVQYR